MGGAKKKQRTAAANGVAKPAAKAKAQPKTKAAQPHTQPKPKTSTPNTAVVTSPPGSPPADGSKAAFLKLFWTLAESDRAARTQAAAALLGFLRELDHDAAEQAAQVQYTLKRLVRGLASSRDAARQGFSTALAGLLADFAAQLPLADARAKLHDAMQVSSAMKGMEQREHMFGRLFGLLALHRSGRLAQDAELQVAIINELLEMAQWKKWFREACFEAALSILADVPKQRFVADVAAPMAAALSGEVAEFNADQVLLAVGVQHYISAAGITKDELPEDYVALAFLRRKHVHLLAEPLRAASGTFPRVHSAWLGVFGHVLKAGADGQADGELFQEAWTVLVENSLVGGPQATHERRGLAFKLFELVAPQLPRPLLRAALTPKFVACLYRNAVAKKNYLHDAARHCVKAFAASARSECVHFLAKLVVAPLPSLLESSSEPDNDEEQEQQAETKDRIARGGFDAIVAIEEEKERAEQRQRRADSVRLWALDALVATLTDSLKSAESADEASSALDDDVLRFLAAHALFAVEPATPVAKKSKKKAKKPASGSELDAAVLGAPTPVLSSVVVSHIKTRLYALLGLRLGVTDAAKTSVLARVFAACESLSASRALRKPLDDETAELASSLRDTVATIVSERLPAAKDDEASRQQLEAFALLMMSASLQLLDVDQRREAAVAAADVAACYTALLGEKKKASKKKAKKTKDEPETEPIDVLTDLLLSLLAQDSSAVRDLVTHVFRSVLPLLGASSLAAMTSVLAPQEATSDGPRGEEDEDEEMEEEDEEEEEEVVLSSAADVSAALQEDAKLAELHREDLALAAIVGQVKDRAKRKADAKKLRLAGVHFQLRVLDLLALFMAKHATSALLVPLAWPLVEARAAISPQDAERRVLAERLESVAMHKLLRLKEAPTLDAEAKSETLAALERVVKLLSTKPLDKAHAGKVAAAAVVFYVRVLVGGDSADAKTAKQVAATLAPAVHDAFAKKHGRFPRSAVEDLASQLPVASVHVVLPALAAAVADADSSADDFTQSEAFRLLASLTRAKVTAGEHEQQVVASERPKMAAAATRALAAGKDEGEAKAKKTKRVKAVLACALQLVKGWRSAADNKKKPTKADDAAVKALVAAVAALQTSSPVLRGMASQIAAAAVGETPSKDKDAAADKRAGKKRKHAGDDADEEEL